MADETQRAISDLTNNVTSSLQGWLEANPLLGTIVIAVLILALAWLGQLITRRYLLVLIDRLVSANKRSWDDALIKRGVLSRLSWAVPLLIIRAGLPFLPLLPAGLADFIGRALAASLVIIFARAISAFINAFGDVYAKLPRAKERPIKSYLQGIILVLYILAGVAAFAALIDRDPFLILSGIGAASAILLLIFRDTILSLVAGVQLTSNDLIRVGDWIEMSQFGADGDVVDIALNTVRIQNWDKTFTVIPTHMFLEHSFRNWRGMQESGGRRIKRSLNIDMSTVRFLSPEEVDGLRRFSLLREYLEAKDQELAAWHSEHMESLRDRVNARRLTNLGTFRAYITNYLKANPRIHKDLTFLVRQLQPTPQGVPIEIYVFTTDTRWAVYEGIQADIFDHLLAIAPEFDLAVFQDPSGRDFDSFHALAGAHERETQVLKRSAES